MPYRAVASPMAAIRILGNAAAPSLSVAMTPALQAQLNNRRGRANRMPARIDRPGSSSVPITRKAADHTSLSERFQPLDARSVKVAAGDMLTRRPPILTGSRRSSPDNGSGVPGIDGSLGPRTIGGWRGSPLSMGESVDEALGHGNGRISDRRTAIAGLLSPTHARRPAFNGRPAKFLPAPVQVSGRAAALLGDTTSNAARTHILFTSPARASHRGTSQLDNSGRARTEGLPLGKNGDGNAPRRRQTSSQPSLTINFHPSVEIKSLPDRVGRQSIVDALASIVTN